MADPQVIIEVVGEGKTDIGELDPGKGSLGSPEKGVVPLLVHRLCNQPVSMQIKRTRIADLQQRGGLNRKVAFAKRQASISGRHGLVFVVDTEGDSPNRKIEELIAGRDSCYSEFPTVVGVAHPCIEAWLLADAEAITKGLKVTVLHAPLPADPEALKAPRHDRAENPKTILGRCAGFDGTVTTIQATAIARHIDLSLLISICQVGFKPFAEEVRSHLLPLFHP